MLVSIIVPVYNSEKYVEKCIKSLVDQTYQKVEIVLIDDGSTDASGIICENYAKKDKRIIVEHQENKGHNCARKNGLALAKGNWICFVDSDDWVEPEMIESMVREMERTGADFVHTGTLLEYANETVFDCRYEEQVICDPKNNLTLWRKILAVDTENYINRGLTRKLFRRELIEKCYSETPNELKYGEDFVTIVRCILESKKISFVKKAFYHYNLRDDSISRTSGIERIYMAVYQYEEIRKIFDEYCLNREMAEMLEKACVKENWWTLKWSTACKIPELTYWINGIEQFFNKKIVLYGAGKVGYNYLTQLSKYDRIHIVGWIDSSPRKYAYQEREVLGIDFLQETEFDIVLISVLKEEIAQDIVDCLLKRGIPEEKIVWRKPQKMF